VDRAPPAPANDGPRPGRRPPSPARLTRDHERPRPGAAGTTVDATSISAAYFAAPILTTYGDHVGLAPALNETRGHHHRPRRRILSRTSAADRPAPASFGSDPPPAPASP
jgi:hypothetical protein